MFFAKQGLCRTFAGMEKANKKVLVIPFIVSIVFIAVSFNSLAQGIEKAQIWRIIIAGLGGSWFLFVAIVSGKRLFVKDKDPV